MPADPLEVVSSTAEAALVTDDEGRVVIWNRAAERLLGYDAARVLGKPCHEILCGLDVFGNRYCGEDCALKQMSRRREAVHHFEMDIRKASGETIRASFSIVVLPGARPSQYSLVHLFRPVDRSSEAEELVRRILKTSPAPGLPALAGASPRSAAQPAPLTAREIEILRLMANGDSTSHIAGSLFISQVTVRNHIQNILRKLEVHSKLEAVSLALRTHLI